jgi:tripartite-type tricarboxylate transporter receptor subunit TctC
VVPAPPGGTTDTLTRLYASKFQERFGQPFVIENKPGASLMIGTNAVAKAAPDGYTLLVTVGSHAQNLHLQKNMPYDTVRDFAPVAMVNITPMIVTVSAKSGIRNMDDFVALAKAGKASYGSYGVGTTPHILGRLVEQDIGAEMLHVPFKGEAPVMNDILAGNVTTSFISTITAMPHIQAGTAVPIAVAGKKRLPQLPEVPTLTEAGIESVAVDGWTGYFAPAGTPADVLDKLSQAFIEVTNMPDIRERFVSNGLVPAPMGHQEFGSFMQGQYTQWGQMIKKAGVKLE